MGALLQRIPHEPDIALGAGADAFTAVRGVATTNKALGSQLARIQPSGAACRTLAQLPGASHRWRLSGPGILGDVIDDASLRAWAVSVYDELVSWWGPLKAGRRGIVQRTLARLLIERVTDVWVERTPDLVATLPALPGTPR